MFLREKQLVINLVYNVERNSSIVNWRNKNSTEGRKQNRKNIIEFSNYTFLLQTLFHKTNIVVRWEKISLYTLCVCVLVIYV